MEIVQTISNAVVLILVGALISWQLSGRFKAFESRFQALEARLDNIQRSVDGLRSDLTQVALAVGLQPGPRRGA